MSTTKIVTVHCDACGQWTDAGMPCYTAAEARKAARSAGWHRNAGQDICPDCWAEREATDVADSTPAQQDDSIGAET